MTIVAWDFKLSKKNMCLDVSLLYVNGYIYGLLVKCWTVLYAFWGSIPGNSKWGKLMSLSRTGGFCPSTPVSFLTLITENASPCSLPRREIFDIISCQKLSVLSLWNNQSFKIFWDIFIYFKQYFIEKFIQFLNSSALQKSISNTSWRNLFSFWTRLRCRKAATLWCTWPLIWLRSTG